jgi:hypothetical protein
MLAMIIGYALTILFVAIAALFLIGACRQTGHAGIGRALLRLYGFVTFGFFALVAALLAGI